uniref:Synaptonemal complex protein 1 n=1 Tax=Myripristis murdjan TaxID=586833 RepID=A0A667WJJ8_9TELE
MDRDKGFNFKLLVPPRVNSGHVFAVRPQEIIEDCGASMLTKQQGYSKCFNKENSIPFSNTNMVIYEFKISSLPVIVNPVQLYSNLLDEVDKIKSWKVKVDSETVQRERKLQENKKTIETQRKAIQELQFGNESLSIKLEEQISENEDLRNKNSATRNLCNILKDTFERSAEKMQLFESDREETHQFLLENSESIQVNIATFPHKGRQRRNWSDTKILFIAFADQQYELLKSSKNEQDSLLQKLQTAEQLCKEMEVSSVESLSLEQSKEEYEEIILQKDNSLQELNRVKDQQADKLEQIQTAIQELQKSLTFEMQSLKEESHNLKRHSEETQQNLLEDLRSKSIFAEELQNEVNKLKCTVAEVTKNKEDAELKCQHKIADMVALMEKHKSQYDRMVEEKDAELDEIKKKEMEAVASRMAMVWLKKNYREGKCFFSLASVMYFFLFKTICLLHFERYFSILEAFFIVFQKNLQKELNDLKKDMSSKKNSQQSEAKDKQVQNIVVTLFAFFPSKGIQNEDLRTHRSSTNWTGATPKIKVKSYQSSISQHVPKMLFLLIFTLLPLQSYRIRTPPSVEKSAPWRKGIIDPDSKSDSSEQNELLTFVDAPEPSVLASNSKLNIFSKSPAIHKSPGSSLKLAAIKRMRDAGWTAVTGCDKKKKTTEKIFA